MSKRILIIGPNHAGKAFLAHYIEHGEIGGRRKAHITFGQDTICVPGTYLESPWMHKHIIAMKQKADIVLMLHKRQKVKEAYPPNFEKVFNQPVIQVLTDSSEIEDDLSQEGRQRLLLAAGLTTNDCYLKLNQEVDFKRLLTRVQQERRAKNGNV
ncbi:EutP/PduV family microcompartment system protein [Vagococcus silagei]|uniref:Ethanolamine utilization protein EutP n=1 Tax=Vagococcus silagei TaxID=2508885 RepID=A0A4S3B640_9ENTE|nr:EutP/PduV family microcompartment system protein [Vagococcus silagei]THB60986.1 hypothetical protein ESZ54_08445 [Vagococcus silagei]